MSHERTDVTREDLARDLYDYESPRDGTAIPWERASEFTRDAYRESVKPFWHRFQALLAANRALQRGLRQTLLAVAVVTDPGDALEMLQCATGKDEAVAGPHGDPLHLERHGERGRNEDEDVVPSPG